MEFFNPVSGDTVAFCEESQLEGKSGKAVKQFLAAVVGLPRFRQKLLVEDGSREIPDD